MTVIFFNQNKASNLTRMGGIVLVPAISSIVFNNNLIKLSISAFQNLNGSTDFRV